jgi:HEAT repeat protein
VSAATAATLVAALRSTDLDARRDALERLAAGGEPLEVELALAVVGCLAGPRKDVQRRAVDVLRAGGGDRLAPVLASLRATCADATAPDQRWGAAYALGRLGCFTPVMIAPLLEALATPDGDQRWAAAELLVTYGRAADAEVRSALHGALGDPRPALRKMVLYVLRDLGGGAASVGEAFARAMADTDVGVRHAALSGLVRLDPLPVSARALVLAMARADPDVGIRRAAVSALGRFGPGEDDVEAVLDAALASDDPALRRAAAAARKRR